MRPMKDSEIPGFGKIPCGWSVNRLKYHFKFGKGLSITKADLKEQGIPVISYGQVHAKFNTGTGITDDLVRYVDEETALTSGNAKTQTGDFIFADTSEDVDGIGNCVFVDKENIYGGYHTILLNFSGKHNCCPKYIAHLFLSDGWRSQLRSQANGTKVYSITKTMLANTHIILPNYTEQQRIADFLDKKCADIDTVISEAKAAIEDYKLLKQSIITQAVTKGLNPNAEMKDSGIEWIGEVPTEWKIKRLKYYFNFGKGLSITKADLKPMGVPVISYGQIHAKSNTGIGIADDLIRYVEDEIALCAENSKTKPNDFIFADTSEDIEGVGNCIFVDRSNVYAGYHTIILDLNNNEGVYAKYLAYQFQSDDWRAQLRTRVNGTKVYSITKTILSKTHILLPSYREQLDIVKFLDDKCAEIDAIISDKEQMISDLEEYKKSLIFECVTGKFEVA